jgi:hypothetical protein
MNHALEIGKLLRSSTTGCVVGCSATQLEAPQFGGMVSIPLEQGYTIYGLIYDIHIDDDGLVRQLVTSQRVSQEVIDDNRLNRNVPLEISVLFTGHEQAGRIYHLLPPRPALTLDAIYPCPAGEVARFTSAGRFGYFRHILRSQEAPVAELLAAHLKLASEAHQDEAWLQAATRELITVLRDDYPVLMNVLNAISDL